MKAKEYQSVSEYIDEQSPETRKALGELRSYILEAVPAAIELINYNMPAFALTKDGKRDKQVMIAAYKKHVGFYPNPRVIEHFSEELKAYKTAKATVQFPLNKPLPKDLIIRMLKFRKEQLEKANQLP